MSVSQFCYSACFENGNLFQQIDILGNNLNIIQISHLLRSDFICEEHQMKEGNCTQLNWVAWEYIKGTHAHLRHLLLSQSLSVMGHTHSHLPLEISIPFTWPSFHHLMITRRWATTSTSKIQVFVRAKCHPIVVIYSCFSSLTCRTVQFLLGSYLFCVYC